MNQERRHVMNQTRKNLENELESLLERLNMNPDFARLVFDLPRRKFSGLSIRGFFMHTVFEYIREQAEIEGIEVKMKDNLRLFDTQLPLVFELIMAVQYLENQILDSKDGVRNGRSYNMKKIRGNTISGHYLKDVVYHYIDTIMFPDEPAHRKIVTHFVRRSFQVVDEAQFLEYEYSSYENFRKGFDPLPFLSAFAAETIDLDLIDQLWLKFRHEGLSASPESFTRFYLQRIFCATAAPFTLMAQLILQLTGYEGKEGINLLQFVKSFGMLCQMVNDLTDLVPMGYGEGTHAKRPEDAYADLRKNSPTIPLIFFLDRYPKYPYKNLRSRLYSSEKQHIVFDLLKPMCCETLIPFLMEWAEEFKEDFLVQENKQSPILADMITIADPRSRYFRHFGSISKRKRLKKQTNNPFQ